MKNFKKIVLFFIISFPLLVMKSIHSFPENQEETVLSPDVGMEADDDAETSDNDLDQDCPWCHRAIDFNEESPLVLLHFETGDFDKHFAHKNCFDRFFEPPLRETEIHCPVYGCSVPIFIKPFRFLDIGHIFIGPICFEMAYCVGTHVLVYADGYTIVFYDVPWAIQKTVSMQNVFIEGCLKFYDNHPWLWQPQDHID